MTTNVSGLGNWLKRTFGGDETDEKTSDTNATTGGDLHQEPVVVWEAANALEAQVVKGRLESEGIPAVVRGEAVGSIYGLTTGGLAMAEVLVPAALADKAEKILSEDAAADVDADSVAEDEAGQES